MFEFRSVEFNGSWLLRYDMKSYDDIIDSCDISPTLRLKWCYKTVKVYLYIDYA